MLASVVLTSCTFREVLIQAVDRAPTNRLVLFQAGKSCEMFVGYNILPIDELAGLMIIGPYFLPFLLVTGCECFPIDLIFHDW